jgi:hypothetical protein
MRRLRRGGGDRLAGGDYLGKGRMQALAVFDRHAEPLDHGSWDLLRARTECSTTGGQGDGEAAFVGGVPLAAPFVRPVSAGEVKRR